MAETTSKNGIVEYRAKLDYLKADGMCPDCGMRASRHASSAECIRDLCGMIVHLRLGPKVRLMVIADLREILARAENEVNRKVKSPE